MGNPFSKICGGRSRLTSSPYLKAKLQNFEGRTETKSTPEETESGTDERSQSDNIRVEANVHDSFSERSVHDSKDDSSDLCVYDWLYDSLIDSSEETSVLLGKVSISVLETLTKAYYFFVYTKCIYTLYL